MKVIVSGDVLGDPAISVWKLHQLFSHACEGRHVLAFDPPKALDSWLDARDPQTRAAYAQAIRLATRAVAVLPADVATVRVEPTVSPRWEDPVAVLPLDDALEILSEPLGILVEDADNDWAFLLGIMRTSERNRIKAAVTKRWAEPLHGGGSGIKSRLEARLKHHAKRFRTFLMFDSDRRHPDELDPSWKPQGKEGCEGYEVEQMARRSLPERYWMLRRRFIESYMPEAELRNGASVIASRDTVDAFYKMSQIERWYYNMKKGFEGDAPKENKDRRRELYKTADEKALWRGFGKGLADRYLQALEREFDWDPEAREEASLALSRLLRLL